MHNVDQCSAVESDDQAQRSAVRGQVGHEDAKACLCIFDIDRTLTSKQGTQALRVRSPLSSFFFSQMMDFSFVGNSQKLREGTCVIHCVPRSPRSHFA